jgi:hypothetical protein
MKRLYILTLCSLALAAAVFFLKKKNPTTVAAGAGLVIPKEWLAVNKSPQTPTADVRPADQTFLTFPEWYLVFSPEEQANYFMGQTSTTFPFMSHTAQIWESYKIVNDQIKGNFPDNPGYHFMIWVIGTSASVEYAVKAWYETVIGRTTDTGEPLTAEDLFNAKFTRDYVDFIKDTPWYAFDFKSRLKTLWTDIPWTGSNFVRKVERRYILTSELMVKYGYGKLIGLGTEQVYDEGLLTTAVVLDNDSVAYLPRYDRFANAALSVAKSGRSFKEVAGNTSAIIVSVLVSVDYHLELAGTKGVFSQVISSDPRQKRIVLATPVAQLTSVLLQLEKDRIEIEHVFDF